MPKLVLICAVLLLHLWWFTDLEVDHQSSGGNMVQNEKWKFRSEGHQKIKFCFEGSKKKKQIASAPRPDD